MEPYYLGDTDWKRNPGGSFGFTDDGLQFRELIYKGRIDKGEQFLTQFAKATACPIPAESHLKLKEGPVINDEDGVIGQALLRFEGMQPGEGNMPGRDSQQETESWYHEIKEVTLQHILKASRAKYSYQSPVVIYNYIDDHKRDEDSIATRFRHPTPWAGRKNEMEEIMKPFALVSWVDQKQALPATKRDAFLGFAPEPTIEGQHKLVGLYRVKQVSGFQSINREADDIYRHTEFHNLVLEYVPQ